MKKIYYSFFLFIIPAYLYSLEIKSVSQVCQLTGEGTINHTELAGIKGTDLGIPVEYKRWMFFFFGDTFNTKDIHDPKAEWRSNVMAYSTDSDASDGIVFDDWIRDNYSFAREMIHSDKIDKKEITVIPTAGITIGNRVWVAYMSVNHWGESGKWNCNYSGYAYSDDAGSNMHKYSGIKWKGDSNFVQLAFARQSSDIYIWGTPSGRFGGVKLATVDESNFGSFKSYRYFIGIDTVNQMSLWTNKEKDAAEIISPPVGEISVAWNDYLQRWIMTYLNEEKHEIVIRDSPQPWGPWSEEKVLVHGYGEYTGLFGAYIHPRFFENGGKSVYFLMTLWPKYNVFLMKATFEK